MVKVTCEEDCGNAPKKQFIKDFNIAYAQADVPALLSMMTDDIEWHLIGADHIHGKEAFKKSLADMSMIEAEELIIDNIISHGDRVAANGEMVYKNNRIAFCDIYEFDSHGKNAKIKKMTSYGIEL